MNSIERLAGPPIRSSPAPQGSWGRMHSGWIKVRLCHGHGRSYLTPDALIGFGGTRFFRPSFFGAPRLAFDVPSTSNRHGPRHHEAILDLDVAAPRGAIASRVLVAFRSDELVRTYEDGAQLFRAAYRAPLASKLSEQVAGRCGVLPDGDFGLNVYHHTDAQCAEMILNSGELWSSSFNLAGTAKLTDVSHLYFTTLPSIDSEEDLRRLAMSSSATVSFQTTSDRVREAAVALPVYQGGVDGRCSTVPLTVPLGQVAPPHVLRHPLTREEPAYYEVVGQEILRVAVKPGASGKIDGGVIKVDNGDLKWFDHLVEGDASDTVGVIEPMREADASRVAYIEALSSKENLFEFWKNNANRDLYSGREIFGRIL